MASQYKSYFPKIASPTTPQIRMAFADYEGQCNMTFHSLDLKLDWLYYLSQPLRMSIAALQVRQQETGAAHSVVSRPHAHNVLILREDIKNISIMARYFEALDGDIECADYAPYLIFSSINIPRKLFSSIHHAFIYADIDRHASVDYSRQTGMGSEDFLLKEHKNGVRQLKEELKIWLKSSLK